MFKFLFPDSSLSDISKSVSTDYFFSWLRITFSCLLWCLLSLCYITDIVYVIETQDPVNFPWTVLIFALADKFLIG